MPPRKWLRTTPPTWCASAWANNIAFVSILGLFVVAYLVIGYQGLMGVGLPRLHPDQPVKFIHSVHVCENEVDCQYCHHSAYESKHAGSVHQRLHELPRR